MKKSKNLPNYNPSEIEPKWREIWERSKLYEPALKAAKRPFGKTQGSPRAFTPRGKPFYNLMMFPYPSAEGLHVGNVYAFCGSDIYGRYMAMRGYDVFEPIGLDGFGIHSENYALKIGKHPMELARRTEANFYRQLRSFGNRYSWSHKLETYDPSYYKWTQWIFVQLFKAGLVYWAKASVNWCPSCKTVLADEQVIGLGVCERCGTEVERRDLPQWFFRITKYAQKLLDNLDDLDWSEKVKIAQHNWLGKSQGLEILFSCDMESDCLISVFTTRPDTIFGVTFMALAAEHPLVTKIIDKTKGLLRQEIREYVGYSLKKSESQRTGPKIGDENSVKTGIFTGFYCRNPVSKKKVPLYIADYVLTGYGTGAVMGVPAHDQRDWEFARAHKLEIVEVIRPTGGPASAEASAGRPASKVNPLHGRRVSRGVFTSYGTLVNSGRLDGLSSDRAIQIITKYIINNHLGKEMVHWHLRDWIISRQRYWGPPIPMIYCEACAKQGKSWFTTSEAESFMKKFQTPSSKTQINSKSLNSKQFGIWNLRFGDSRRMAGWYPVPEKDLPVELPFIKNFKPTGTGVSPLAQDPDFVNVACPECGLRARRETDVSDTFLDSAWYFLRYPSVSEENSKSQTLNSKQIINSKISNSKKGLGFSASNLGFPWNSEITRRWLPVDMYIGGAEHAVLHLLYSRFLTMALEDLGLLEFGEPFKKFRAHGLLIAGGAKMSKSKGNIVLPDPYIEKYGADTLRCYLMFCGRFTQGGDFRDTGIEGMAKFLKRVWRLVLSAGPVSSGSPAPQSVPDKAEIPSSQGTPLAATRSAKPDNPTTGQPENLHLMHKTIKKVTEDIEDLSYNTAIAALMEWLNFLEERSAGPAGLHPTPTASLILSQASQTPTTDTSSAKGLGPGARAGSPHPSPADLFSREEIENLLLLLAPFAPHMTEELWQLVHSSEFVVGSRDSKNSSLNYDLQAKRTNNWSIHSQPWPKFDSKLARAKKITLVVQVNGKVRDKITVLRGVSEEEAKKLALGLPKVQKYMVRKPKMIIFVADRLINLVI